MNILQENVIAGLKRAVEIRDLGGYYSTEQIHSSGSYNEGLVEGSAEIAEFILGALNSAAVIEKLKALQQMGDECKYEEESEAYLRGYRQGRANLAAELNEYIK